MNKYFIPSAIVLNFVLCCVAIYRSYPLSVGMDYIGIIFTAMTALVAILLVTQLINYTFIHERVRQIASEEARQMTDDFKTVIDSVMQSLTHCTLFNGGNITSSFYIAMKSLQKASLCRDTELRRVTVGYILELIHNIITIHKKSRACRLCPGERDNYLYLLGQLEGRYIDEITDFVKSAEEEKTDITLFSGSGSTFFGISIDADNTMRVVITDTDKEYHRNGYKNQ